MRQGVHNARVQRADLLQARSRERPLWRRAFVHTNPHLDLAEQREDAGDVIEARDDGGLAMRLRKDPSWCDAVMDEKSRQRQSDKISVKGREGRIGKLGKGLHTIHRRPLSGSEACSLRHEDKSGVRARSTWIYLRRITTRTSAAVLHTRSDQGLRMTSLHAYATLQQCARPRQMRHAMSHRDLHRSGTRYH